MLEVLTNSSNMTEILWNFGRYKDKKRITVKQNPHFYKSLPGSKEEYGYDFRRHPMTNFVDAPKVHVLTDRLGCVYIDSGRVIRAFGNVWQPKDAIIFKGSCLMFLEFPPFDVPSDIVGQLEGESVVQASLQLEGAPKSWYLEGSRSSTSPTNTVLAGPFRDWREPIRQELIFRDTSVCIRGYEDYHTLIISTG